MKNRSVLYLACFALIFMASCQQEIDWGLGSASDQLLIRVNSKTGTDSTIVTYTYNSSRQLIGENTAGVSGGTSIDNDLKIYRNSSGIIQRTVQVASALVAAGLDSIVTFYNYNAGTSRYTSSLFSITLMGTTVSDSAVYTYDANGRITSDEHYLKTGILPPVLGLRNQYTYSADGANLLGIQQSAPTTLGGPLTLLSTQAFTYDTRKSPLNIRQEAVLIIRPGLYSSHNANRTEMVNTIDPTLDLTTDLTYRYNSAGKPDSSFATLTPGGQVTASKYFYQ